MRALCVMCSVFRIHYFEVSSRLRSSEIESTHFRLTLSVLQASFQKILHFLDCQSSVHSQGWLSPLR